MIGKIVIGKYFYGVLAYNEKKVSEGKGYVIDSNIKHGSTVEMTEEFNMIRQLRSSLGNAVFHISLNLPHSETIDDTTFAALGCDYLMEMGFDNNQFIMYRHTDTKHEHIHIIANRVRYSGRVTSDSNINRKSRALLNELELKYGLTQSLGNAKSKKALTQKEMEKTLRTGNIPIKLTLQKEIGSAISNSTNTSQFVAALKSRKIYLRFNASRTTGRVSGISFDYQGIIYKGSTLGKQYSWNSIKKHIDYEQDRDRTIVFENSGPVGAATESVGAITNGPQRTVEVPAGDVERAQNADEKPEHDVAKDKGVGWVAPLVEENPWNAFKLELEETDRFRRKKRRTKKGLGR